MSERPGLLSRTAARRLAELEAPGINTLYRGQPSVVWQQAKGSEVVDVDGNRYLDFTSGFGAAALGHGDPAVVAAVREQAGELLHGLGDVAAHPARIAAAELLVALAPMAPAKLYWAVSGSDAIEIALKTARLATGRRRVVVFEAAYHGLSLGALAASSREAFRAPFAAHLDPYLTRLEAAAPMATIDGVLRGDDVAAVLVEPIAGREGIAVPPAGWLGELAERAAAHGTLLVLDEILTGGNRTGSFWAAEHESVVADLVCFGKAVASGLPIAGVLGHAHLLAAWPESGEALHTGTFVAHPLACAALLATLPRLADPALGQRVTLLGERIARHFEDRLDAVLLARHGRGLMQGLELASAERAARLAELARAGGLLVLAGGRRGSMVQLLPALTITDVELERGLAVLDLALAGLADP